jgi:chitinase
MATGCSTISTLTSVYAKEASTYGTKRLDFDIEGNTLHNTSANDRRAKALAALQRQDPSIQVDFTVAVDPGGMPSDVMGMLKNAVSNGVKINLINLMTMDFGSGSNLNQGISASKGAHSQIASLFPGLSSAQLWAKLGATFIAGRNDDGTFFSASDAGKFETFAAQNGMGELSFWEVHDYDRVNSSSNGGAWAYSKTFNKITGGAPPPPPPSPSASGGSGTSYVGAGSGKCLDDPKSSVTNGTQLEIWTCHASANQQFTATGGTLRVLGKCMDAYNNQTANGTKVEIWSCNGGANQQWTYNSSSGTIVGAQSGKCLTVRGASTSNGALLILYTCNGGSNQKWTRQ